MHWLGKLSPVVLFALMCSTARAEPIPIVIDTSPYVGAGAVLVFEFIDGGPPANSVTVSSFTTDGTLAGFARTGAVIGALPGLVTLFDFAMFNEYQQAIVLGTSIAFAFEPTGNPPDPSSIPDSFSVFLLNSLTFLPLFGTSDPTGDNSLFVYTFGDPNPLSIYSSTVSVGEPSTGWLIVLSLLVMVFMLNLRKQRYVGRTGAWIEPSDTSRGYFFAGT